MRQGYTAAVPAPAAMALSDDDEQAMMRDIGSAVAQAVEAGADISDDAAISILATLHAPAHKLTATTAVKHTVAQAFRASNVPGALREMHNSDWQNAAGRYMGLAVQNEGRGMAKDERDALWRHYRALPSGLYGLVGLLREGMRAAQAVGDARLGKQLSVAAYGVCDAREWVESRFSLPNIRATTNASQHNTITTDLHNLTTREALETCEQELNVFLQRNGGAGYYDWTIIPGRGRNSGEGGPKLLPAVCEWLASLGMAWELHNGGGCLLVRITPQHLCQLKAAGWAHAAAR